MCDDVLDADPRVSKVVEPSAPEAVPHQTRCEALLRIISWVAVAIPDEIKHITSELLQLAGHGVTDMHLRQLSHALPFATPATERKLQMSMIEAIPVPGLRRDAGHPIIKQLLRELLGGFTLRVFMFLIDMILPQLDAYEIKTAQQITHPPESVLLSQMAKEGRAGINMRLSYSFAAYAGVHIGLLFIDTYPIFLFCEQEQCHEAHPAIYVIEGNSMGWNLMSWRVDLYSSISLLNTNLTWYVCCC